MRNRTLIYGAVAMLLLVGAPAMAQDFENEKAGRCSPEGTWLGMNFTEGIPFIITIERAGFGRFSVVGEGPTAPLVQEDTSWRGEAVRTGARSFILRQLSLGTDANDLVMLAAVEGEMVFSSCGHFDLTMYSLGFYVWRMGIVPFVDPFDIPYIPPGPVATAAYDRMPSP